MGNHCLLIFRPSRAIRWNNKEPLVGTTLPLARTMKPRSPVNETTRDQENLRKSREASAFSAASEIRGRTGLDGTWKEII